MGNFDVGVRAIVLLLSGAAVVALVIAAWRSFASWRRGRWVGSLFYLLARLGAAGVIYEVAEAVYHVPRVPLSQAAVRYSLALALTCIGYIGGLAQEGRRDRRRTDHKEEPT